MTTRPRGDARTRAHLAWLPLGPNLAASRCGPGPTVARSARCDRCVNRPGSGSCAGRWSCYGFVMAKASLLGSLFLAGASLVACRPEPTQEPPTQPAPVPGLEGAKNPEQAQVAVAPAVSQMCNLPTPNFAYDSASLSVAASATLDALAECFINGPAKAETMLLVGHADPRGDEEYNLGLGQRRADSVAGYVMGRGLASTRVNTSSRGELDAVGTNEDTWHRDRRVEIRLANK
ncbi:MAG: OmpA family protein [Myxococcales bacterium FL481]|nr:MAG: OmpA family protein [Myxococcales bacterium FL481]